MPYISSGRSVSDLKAHLVLTVKYRKKVLTAEMLQHLKATTSRTLSKWECELIEFNGEADHVHILFRYYPQVQLSKLVNNLKTVTSRLLRKDFDSELIALLYKQTLWNNSYFIASCGGVTVETLRKYIENQGQP